MGCGSSGTQTSSTTSQPPQAVLNDYQNLINQAQGVASQPLEQYQGNLVAPFNSTQNQAFNEVQGAQGAATPYINSAQQYAQQGATPINAEQLSGYSSLGTEGQNYLTAANAPLSQSYDQMSDQTINAVGSLANQNLASSTSGLNYPTMSASQLSALPGQSIGDIGSSAAGFGSSQIQGLTGQGIANLNQSVNDINVPGYSAASLSSYESPYTQQVVQATQAEENEQDAEQQQSVIGNAISSGAFGGDRSAIAQSELANQQDLANSQTIANINQQGFAQAQGELNTQQQTALQTGTAQAGVAQSAAQQQLGEYNTQAGLEQSAGTSLAGIYGQQSQLGETAAQQEAALEQGASSQQLGYVTGQQQLGLTSAEQQAALAEQSAGLGLGEYNTQQQAGVGAQEATGWLNENSGYAEGNLGNEALNTDLTGASAELTAGGTEQSLAQEQLNIPYEEYLQAQAYPFQTTGWLGGLTEGVGSEEGGTSSTTTPGPSTASELTGLGVAGLGAAAVYNSTSSLNRGGRVGGTREPAAYRHRRDAGGLVPNVSVSFAPQYSGQSGKGPPSPPGIVPQQQSGGAQIGSALGPLMKSSGTSGLPAGEIGGGMGPGGVSGGGPGDMSSGEGWLGQAGDAIGGAFSDAGDWLGDLNTGGRVHRLFGGGTGVGNNGANLGYTLPQLPWYAKAGASLVPGLGTLSSAYTAGANVYNTNQNADTLGSMGMPLSTGQQLGGYFGLNGYNGTGQNAINSYLENSDSPATALNNAEGTTLGRQEFNVTTPGGILSGPPDNTTPTLADTSTPDTNSTTLAVPTNPGEGDHGGGPSGGGPANGGGFIQGVTGMPGQTGSHIAGPPAGGWQGVGGSGGGGSGGDDSGGSGGDDSGGGGGGGSGLTHAADAEWRGGRLRRAMGGPGMGLIGGYNPAEQGATGTSNAPNAPVAGPGPQAFRPGGVTQLPISVFGGPGGESYGGGNPPTAPWPQQAQPMAGGIAAPISTGSPVPGAGPMQRAPGGGFMPPQVNSAPPQQGGAGNTMMPARPPALGLPPGGGVTQTGPGTYSGQQQGGGNPPTAQWPGAGGPMPQQPRPMQGTPPSTGGPGSPAPLSGANQYMMQNLIGPQMAARPATGGPAAQTGTGSPAPTQQQGGPMQRFGAGMMPPGGTYGGSSYPGRPFGGGVTQGAPGTWGGGQQQNTGTVPTQGAPSTWGGQQAQGGQYGGGQLPPGMYGGSNQPQFSMLGAAAQPATQALARGGLISGGGAVVPANAYTGFDGGGSIMQAGASASGDPASQGSPIANQQLGSLNNMSEEQLQEMAMRSGPGSPQGAMIQRAIQMKRQNPMTGMTGSSPSGGVSAPAAGGVGAPGMAPPSVQALLRGGAAHGRRSFDGGGGTGADQTPDAVAQTNTVSSDPASLGSVTADPEMAALLTPPSLSGGSGGGTTTMVVKPSPGGVAVQSSDGTSSGATAGTAAAFSPQPQVTLGGGAPSALNPTGGAQPPYPGADPVPVSGATPSRSARAADSPSNSEIASNPWMALVAAGLGMAASRNTHPLGALAEGAQQGVGYLEGQQKAASQQQQLAQENKFKQATLDQAAASLSQHGLESAASLAEEKSFHAQTATNNAAERIQAAADAAEKAKEAALSVAARYAEINKPNWIPNGNGVDPSTGKMAGIEINHTTGAQRFVAPGTPESALEYSQQLWSQPDPSDPTKPAQQGILYTRKTPTGAPDDTKFVPIAGSATAKPSAGAGTSRPAAFASLDQIDSGALGNIHGADFLSTLPPTQAEKVKATAEGRAPYFTGTATKDPTNRAFNDAVIQYDPTFNTANPTARAKVVNDMVTDPKGGINVLSTATGHAFEMDGAIDALDNSGTSFLGPGIINPIKNAAAAYTDNPNVNNLIEIRQGLAGELRKVYAGAGGNQKEIEDWENSFPLNAGPVTQHAAVKTAMNMLGSKMQATADKWNTAFGTNYSGMDFLDPDAKQKFAELTGQTLTPDQQGPARPWSIIQDARGNPSTAAPDTTGAARNTRSVAAQPAATTPPMAGAKMAPDGNWYVPNPAGGYFKVQQ